MALSKSVLIIIGMFAATIAVAQHLPNKQNISIPAPTDIKIDGKATEWGNKFQAFNRATDIYYTIANDDNYLYFLIQARDPFVINKLYSSGLTITITTPGQKNDRGALHVIYPVYESGNRFHVKMVNKPAGGPEAAAFVKATNQNFTHTATAIRVAGAGIADTLISVYNDDGIRAMAQFDANLYYTCEVAIGARGFEGAIKNGKIGYHMILQAITAKNNDNISSHMGIGPTGAPIKMVHLDITTSMTQYLALTAATDMRGEYTLAKKP